MRSLAGAVLLTIACAGCAVARDHAAPSNDAEAMIRAALARWPDDFAAKRTPNVCGLFAPDAVLVYPDSRDRSFADACAQFAAIFASTTTTFRYAPPAIEEVLVDGDMAVVRLVWTLTVSDASGQVIDVVRENGLDVFRRQPDGSWKIRISYAYPL